MNIPSTSDDTGEPIMPTAPTATTKTAHPPKGKTLVSRIADAARRAVGPAFVATGPDDARFEVRQILRVIVGPDVDALGEEIAAWQAFERKVAILREPVRTARRQELVQSIQRSDDPAAIIAMALEATLSWESPRGVELQLAVQFASRGIVLSRIVPVVDRILRRRDSELPKLREAAERLEGDLASRAAKLGLAVEPRHLSSQVDEAAALLSEFETGWKAHTERLHLEQFSTSRLEGLLSRL